LSLAETLSDTEILRRADIATGANIDGLRWQINVISTNREGDIDEQILEIKATDNQWVAETLKPLRARGQKLLMIGRNMWFSKPNLRKPVPISLRQRLSGGASNGDVASTNYAEDYHPTRLPDELIGDVHCYVFDLAAKEKSVTYDRVKYWINQGTGLGFKAEFYSRSGKLLKTAGFQHENTIQVKGKTLPFISFMSIQDELNGNRSEFTYSEINVETIPASAFRL
jgi:hypothetical protein